MLEFLLIFGVCTLFSVFVAVALFILFKILDFLFDFVYDIVGNPELTVLICLIILFSVILTTFVVYLK